MPFNTGAWGEIGDINQLKALLNDIYLKLDQTTPQTVINGLPTFEDGIRIGNSTTYFELVGNDLKLYVHGTLRQTWTTVLVASHLLMETGDYLLLENGDKIVLEA